MVVGVMPERMGWWARHVSNPLRKRLAAAVWGWMLTPAHNEVRGQGGACALAIARTAPPHPAYANLPRPDPPTQSLLSGALHAHGPSTCTCIFSALHARAARAQRRASVGLPPMQSYTHSMDGFSPGSYAVACGLTWLLVRPGWTIGWSRLGGRLD